MESLIAKWKQTSSSASLSRYSDKKLPQSGQKQEESSPKSLSKSSRSSDESFQKKKLKNNQFQSPQDSKQQICHQITPRFQNSSIKPPSSNKYSDTKRKLNLNDLQMSQKIKTNDASNFSQALDATTYQIFQLFKSQLSQQQMIEQLKIILTDFAEQSSSFSQGKLIQELQLKVNQQEKQMRILKTTQSSMREEMSRNLINELQDKLVESESLRQQLSQQKETLTKRFNELLQDVQKMQAKQEKSEAIQKDNEILAKNNEVLLSQVNHLQEKDQQQQVLWNQQVEDLINMMEILKNQLQSQ